MKAKEVKSACCFLFQVLMNPEDPTFSDGVHPSFRAVALRVREASELEESLCAAQGPRDVKMPEGLVELSQHLKRYVCMHDMVEYRQGKWLD